MVALYINEINEFHLTSPPVVEGNSINLNGTVTITLRDCPVKNTPTIIAISADTIDVYFDPNKIDNHFENQSISGVQNKSTS